MRNIPSSRALENRTGQKFRGLQSSPPLSLPPSGSKRDATILLSVHSKVNFFTRCLKGARETSPRNHDSANGWKLRLYVFTPEVTLFYSCLAAVGEINFHMQNGTSSRGFRRDGRASIPSERGQERLEILGKFGQAAWLQLSFKLRHGPAYAVCGLNSRRVSHEVSVRGRN